MRFAMWNIVLTFIFLLLPISSVDAAEEMEQRIDKLERKAEHHEQLLDGYQKLLEESKSFRENLQQQTQQFQTSIQIQLESLYQTVGVLLTTFMIVLGGLQVYFLYSMGQSRKEAQETMQEIKKKAEKKLQQQKQEFEEEYDKKVKKMMRSSERKLQKVIDQKYDEQLHKILNEEQNIQSIKQIVQKELSYTSARVCFICHTEQEQERLQEKEIPVLREFGLKNKIYTFVYDQHKEQIEEMVKKGEMDVLIYSCEKLERNQKIDHTLMNLINLLKSLGCRVPLLIYTYQRGSQLQDEMEKINEYFYYAIANFPAALLGHLLSLAYAFNRDSS